MSKRGWLRHGIGKGIYLASILLLSLFSVFFLFAGPVQAALSITSSPLLPSGQVGTTYYAALTATGDNPPFTWSIISGSLPPGLNLAGSTGVISGTPTIAGTYNFTARVTDSAAGSASQPFIINISQPPLNFLTISLDDAKEGERYADNIRVSGGTTPYIFSITSGSLPSGLTLNNSTGYISGTPAQGTAGSFSFTVEVTDSSSPTISGQQSFSIIVEKGGYEATITIGSGLKDGQTKVSVSGGIIATLSGGQSTTLSLDLGAIRSVTVDSIVEDPTQEGVRYKAEQTSITVTQSSPMATFDYNTEYSINLKTEPSKVGQISGSGWYKENYTLRVNAPDDVNDPSTQGVQYHFTYWQLPTGETVSGKDLNLTVNAAGTCTAYYDTYYKLTLTSPYGEAKGSDWYKAGSEAEWKVNEPQVKIQNILGVFGGKLNAVNSSGTTLMDSPKTITIEWEPDYTLPFIMIPLTIVLVVLGGYGLYLLLRSLQPKPAPPTPPPFYPYIPPPPPQPVQPPQTTVVMIGGDKPKLGPATTREQLMEKFGELLEKYEDEIKTTSGAKELPGAQTLGTDKRLPVGESIPEAVAEEASAAEDETASCNYTSKRALRVVVGNWRQVETKTAKLPSNKKAAEEMSGIAITWARDIFQEWELLSCWLPRGHKENHEGSVEIVYSLMNTVTEEKIYAPGQELESPTPHYTEGMPQVDVAAREVVTPEKLPPETAS